MPIEELIVNGGMTGVILYMLYGVRIELAKVSAKLDNHIEEASPRTRKPS